MESSRHSLKIRILVPDDNCLSVIQHGVNAANHKFGYVGNMVEDKVPICSNQLGKIYVPVIDAQVIPLAEKAFDDFYHGTFSQIVCPRFETEAQYSNSRMALPCNQLQAPADLHFIAGENRVENRQLQVMQFGLIRQSPKIFR